ncbi:AraC family transcriptional regulator [Rhizobium sp. Root274]|uniref:helix-turn-helix domain-containing protein n=1 Tax=unclassified Rhizobium TaxID=2613769 RepID=UPI000712E741|nr:MULTISPECIES: AraC family transcriptional regulator [unclassified Rhizobium]KQW31216.1 AraC family transcriptional regulator [Rhizobium sp. Root1240]KRD32761.1 AraC family transcriptional regulator [Rhizobium sp. Root274]
MLFVPLSFLVALFLAVFLVRLLREGRDAWGTQGLFLALIILHIVQSLLVGLRWGYGMVQVLAVLPVMASLIPALSYLAFRDLARERQGIARGDWPHLLPSLLVAAILVMSRLPAGLGIPPALRIPVDLVLIASFFGYGLALLWLARLGPDGLVASRLDGTLRSYRALQLTGLALITSALTDISISLDMLWSGGRYSPMVVSAATTLILFLLGLGAVTAGEEEAGEGDTEEVSGETRGGAAEDHDGRGEAGEPADDAAGRTRLEMATDKLTTPMSGANPALGVAKPSNDDHRRIAADLDRLMTERRLWANPDLNLARLARRLGLPARAVSEAVNRVQRISVSHYVNNFRVAEACRLLTTTEMPITRILFEAGFLTKSNFNREFLRVTGLSPTDWRRRDRAGTAAA